VLGRAAEKANRPREQAAELGQKQNRTRGKRKPCSYFSKELTKIEFKHKFEFKQIKTMQQHACNSKPL
jgi:hypothetical protein